MRIAIVPSHAGQPAGRRLARITGPAVPATGAVTELVEIVRRDRVEPLTADAALKIDERDPGPDGKPGRASGVLVQRAAGRRRRAGRKQSPR